MSDRRTPAAAQRQFVDAARRSTRRALTTQQRMARAFVHSADDQRRAQQRVTAAAAGWLALPFAARASAGDSESVARSADTSRDALASMADVADDWWELAFRTATDAAATSDRALGASADLADAWFEAAESAADWSDAATAMDWRDAMEQASASDAEPVAIDVEGGGE